MMAAPTATKPFSRMNGGRRLEFEKLTKEEKDKLREMFEPYECKPGESASLVDDWKG